MEKETSSETTIKLSSIKEMVNKSSTNIVQTSMLSSQGSEMLPGTIGAMKLMDGQTCADMVSSKMAELPSASTLANKMSLFKLDDGADDLSAGEDFKLVHGEQKMSAMSSSSKSTVMNAQSSNSSVVPSAGTETAKPTGKVEETEKETQTSVEQPAPEVTTVDAKPTASEHVAEATAKHETINNTLREIISDIDSNIKEDEAILNLRQQELELLKKQQELSKQIAEQQKLAEQLAAANQLRLEELNKKNLELQQQKTLQEQMSQQQSYIKNEYTQPNEQNSYTKQTEIYESKETIQGSKKPIDLNKIFTPATDNIEICPKNRKLYASSAFYSPSLHPTVEDQVELARRISHSLSDISNQTSKGQSMYDNRKKRSVKWVHESTVQGATEETEYKENAESQTASANRSQFEKIPLKLVMNPRGQVIDFNSVQESVNTKTGLLSPDKCAELVNALQMQKDKGAELFAKRRKKADKWIVDETNAGTQSPSGIPEHNQLPAARPPTSPNVLPAYSDVGKHRVQLNMHQEQLLEKYAQPSLTVVKTPWEAALETGSASTAFVEENNSSPSPYKQAVSPQPYATQYNSNNIPQYEQTQNMKYETNAYSPAPNRGTVASNPQRDLAYKPSIPQGWNAPSVTLPKYVPTQLCENEFAHRQTTPLPMNVMQIAYNDNALRTHTASAQSSQHTADISAVCYAATQAESTNSDKFQAIDSCAYAQMPAKAVDVATEVCNSIPTVEHINEGNISETQTAAVVEQINGQAQTEYEQLPVRDLIHNFELYSKSTETHEEKCNIKSNTKYGEYKCELKDMYVPKEIPLENYAPPPVVAIKPQYENRQFGAANNASYFPAAQPQPQAFPVTTPTNEYAAPVGRVALKPTNSWQDESQQYAKVAPQVNFNPSPLPQEKLSKFENRSEQLLNAPYNTNYQSNAGRVFNTSPTPFGGSPVGGNTIGRTSSPSFRKSYEIPKPYAQQFKRPQNTTSFNNSARGWGCSSQNKCSYPSNAAAYNQGNTYAAQMGGTTGLPFSDF